MSEQRRLNLIKKKRHLVLIRDITVLQKKSNFPLIIFRKRVQILKNINRKRRQQKLQRQIQTFASFVLMTPELWSLYHVDISFRVAFVLRLSNLAQLAEPKYKAAFVLTSEIIQMNKSSNKSILYSSILHINFQNYGESLYPESLTRF